MGIKIGIWLGLLAAAAITYGGYLAMQQEGGLTIGESAPPAEAFSGLATPGGAPATDPPAEAPSPPIPPPAAPPPPHGGAPTPAAGA